MGELAVSDMARDSGEQKFIDNWRTKLALLAAIIVPTISATGAYYKLDSKIDERTSVLELTSTKNFAEKQDLKEIQNDIKDMHSDIVEIKTILKRSR